ncbi:MAG: Fe(2+)-trafficking protein [Nitrososphaerales archaeon]
MSKCSKCGSSFDETKGDPEAVKYSSCSTCWGEWVKYSVMVINEMRLDMSLPEHRKVLKKYERTYFGLEKLEDGMKDYNKEEERVPDNR